MALAKRLFALADKKGKLSGTSIKTIRRGVVRPVQGQGKSWAVMQALLDRPIGRLRFFACVTVATIISGIVIKVLIDMGVFSNGLFLAVLAVNSMAVAIIVKKRLIDIGVRWADMASRICFVVSICLGVWSYNTHINVIKAEAVTSKQATYLETVTNSQTGERVGLSATTGEWERIPVFTKDEIYAELKRRGLSVPNNSVEIARLQALYADALSALISIPAFLCLLLWPSKEGQQQWRERRKLKEEKDHLLREKTRLLAQREIEALKDEVDTLKAKK